MKKTLIPIFLLALFFGVAVPTALAQETIDFEGLAAGTNGGDVFGDMGSGPVVMSGTNPDLPGENAAVIFDSFNPTGGDTDLATLPPDGLGKILIVGEDLVDCCLADGLVDDPDDAKGGELGLDFSALVAVTVFEMTVIDVEGKEGKPLVRFYDPSDTLITTFDMPITGDGNLATMAFGVGVGNVARMEVFLGGSGGIDDIVFQTDSDCGVCDGKVTELTLQYTGSILNASIEIKQGKKKIFESIVNPGDIFPVFHDPDKDDFGKEIKIKVNGEETKIHTSCSKPIGPGLQVGDFLVLGGSSKEGGPLCPVDNGGPPGDGLCEKDSGFKAQIVTMQYTGEHCSASSNSQAGDKTSCSSPLTLANSPASVFLIASDKTDLTNSKTKIYLFNEEVVLGGTFDIDAGEAGEEKLKANTYVQIFDAPGGNLLQFVQFHTSCSQPLRVGDQFGSLLVDTLTVIPK